MTAGVVTVAVKEQCSGKVVVFTQGQLQKNVGVELTLGLAVHH